MDDNTRKLLHDAMDAMLTDDRDTAEIAAVAKRICEALDHQWPPYHGTGWTEDCDEEEDGPFEPCCEISAAERSAA